jgi:N-acetylmuramoyl-L-alanine amidase
MMAKIVLDPGHGGSQTIPRDSSWNNAVGPAGTLEKNLALDLALRARAALREAGHDVLLTRSEDVNLSLKGRAKVAKQFRAHAFVSIHFNASAEHNAQGTETLVHTNYSPQSATLSLAVQDALLSMTGLADRNRTFNRSTRIKPQGLAVLRPDYHDPSTAGCLAEVSFLDRADEEQRLQEADYRERIAHALADGIGSFVGAAVAIVPQDSIDVGDAIELAALDAPGQPTVAALLGLNEVQKEPGPEAELDTADRDESPSIPAAPFSKAFVDNIGPPLALITNEPQWSELEDFVRFIASLGLTHFTADEFLIMGQNHRSGRCSGLNSFPPRNLWNNIVNTALMIDAIRNELGAAIRITSCYRSPAYNTCVSGATNSSHIRFNAIDFTCRAGTPETWRRVAARIRASDPRFTGGIGVYQSSRFLHIDTRGTIANW